MKNNYLKKRCTYFSAILLFLAVTCSQVALASQGILEDQEIQQQVSKINGTVVDDSTGEPIIGASVIIKGTSSGAVTDVDGKFTLNGSANARLQISFLGYTAKEVDAGPGKDAMIRLVQDSKLLDEVVVVGYGVQKKSSLTGAMQAIGEQKLKTITTPRVENMLNGKIPGVFVAEGSGQPGAGSKIIIRGKTTVNGSTDPLWVIDGVIVGSSAGDLNPDDVATISVLKDAASTAIYGSQGSNGVVVVTTKSGKAGKSQVNFSAKMGVTQLNMGNLKMMNGEELYDLYNSFSNPEAFNLNTWWNEDLKKRDFDWKDQVSQNGFTQDYNVSFSGGNENLSTFLSLGLYDETGAVKGYDFTTYSTRFNMKYKVLDWLTIKPQISASRRDILDKQHSVTAMYGMMPWDSPYLPDGSLVGLPPVSTWVDTKETNYLYDLQWNYSTSRNYELSGNFDFDIRLTDWLTFSSVNNYKFGEYTSMTYTDPRSSSGLSSNGSVEDSFSGYDRLYTNQLFRFNKTFNQHNINGIVAYEWNEYNGKITEGIAGGIPPGFIIADVATVPKKVAGNRSQWAVQSYFSNFNYIYSNKYLAQASFRRDGASNFGRDKQYGNFFSVSAGWNIHEEDFFKADFINNLKLRASYGSNGNRPKALYPHYALYSASKAYGYNEMPGALISQVGNDNLSWEKTFTSNIGIDVSFLEKFNLTVDFYDKNTSNLLYSVPFPGVTGITGIWRNVGEVNNKGFEASISADIIRNKEMRWTVDANLGLNRNKITKLYGDKTQIIVGDDSGIAGSASKLWKPGLDIDTWYLAEWAGVNPETGAPQWYATDPTSKERVLTSKYSDASKTPIAIGAYTPDFFGGFSTSFNYKNIDFSAVFNYSVGGTIYNYSRTEYDSDGTYVDRNQMNLMDGWSRWTKPGDVATHPRPTYNNKTNSEKVSSRFLEDGTYLKMKSLTFGYTLPFKLWQISDVRLYASGENLLTITDYSGVDPEIPPTGSVIGSTTGSVIGSTLPGAYPTTRKFVFGLSVNF